MFQSCQNIIKRVSASRQDDHTEMEHNGEQRQQLKQQENEQDSVSTEYLVQNWLEALFAWFQVIVLWHEPHISVCAISGLLSSFLLLTYLAPRFYATIILAMFIYNLNKFWFRHVWPSIRVPPEDGREEEMRMDVDRWTYLHPQLMTLTELKYQIRNLIRLGKGYSQLLLRSRNQNPTYFCSKLCFIFTCTAYLGRTVSGLTLVFFALVIIMTAPGIYLHLLPQQYKLWLQHQYQSLIASNESLNDNEPLNGQVEDEHEDAALQKSTMAHIYKDKVAASMAITVKSLLGNLKKKTHTTSNPESLASLQPERNQQQQPSSTILSNLREDGAKVLYNLIDVTLMGNKDRHQVISNDSGGSQEDEEEKETATANKRSNSSESSAADSISLIENEDDQQDDGFVMLG